MFNNIQLFFLNLKYGTKALLSKLLLQWLELLFATAFLSELCYL